LLVDNVLQRKTGKKEGEKERWRLENILLNCRKSLEINDGKFSA
jgi:hypothetical protein